jgi:hypothetical protein
MRVPGGKLTFSLTIVALMLVMSGSGGSMSAAQAEGSAPVTVVNTPLPVRLTGTGTISGNVNAYQAGTWNVGVTSMPAVQLAAGTTLGITGGVGNVDPRNAFAAELCVDAGGGCGQPVTIPVNKRFVIEQVSGSCGLNDEDDYENWIINAQLNGGTHHHYFKSPTSSTFHFLTRIYADAPGLTVTPTLSGFHHDNECHMTLSGYLVDMTPAFP